MRRETVDLAGLAMETVEFLNVLAEEKRQNISISIDGPVNAVVDRAMIDYFSAAGMKYYEYINEEAEL